MKRLILVSLSLLLIHIPTWSDGGDLGGGITVQMLKDAFRLSPGAFQSLSVEADADEAYETWMNNLNEQKKRKLMEKVFKYHILPQLDD